MAATGLKPGMAKNTARPPMAKALSTDRITSSLAWGLRPSKIRKNGSMVSKMTAKEISIYFRPPPKRSPAQMVMGISSNDSSKVIFVRALSFPVISRCSCREDFRLIQAANIPNDRNMIPYSQPYCPIKSPP